MATSSGTRHTVLSGQGSFSETLYYIALVVLVFQLTVQGIAVAGLAAVEIILILLLDPMAGVVIDRIIHK